MPKYSTGSSGGSDGGDACELCGSETSSLQRANVAGADLLVCSECQPHDDTDKRLSESTDDETTSDAHAVTTSRENHKRSVRDEPGELSPLGRTWD
jgi:hypothetical protein